MLMTGDDAQEFETEAVLRKYLAKQDVHRVHFTLGERACTADWDQRGARAKPVQDKPFRCRIRRAGTGYLVAGLVATPPGDQVQRARGTVKRLGKGWGVEIPHGDLALTAFLPWQVLAAAGIERVASGCQVVVDATWNGRSYEVTLLHWPTPSEIAPPADPASPLVRVIAWVSKAWLDDSRANIVLHFRRQDAVGAFVKTFITSMALQQAGIRALHSAPDDKPSIKDTHDALAQWDERLKAGPLKEPLPIDRLELEVEWLPVEQKWRVQRLVRPRKNLSPEPKMEIDWVEGSILAIAPVKPSSVQTETQPASGADADDESAEYETAERSDDNSSSAPVTLFDIEVAYRHAVTGDGVAEGRVRQGIVDAGSLQPGVSVTVRLRPWEGMWQIAKIHRSVPEDAEPTC